MTSETLRATILRILCNLAPEADPAALRPDVNFRDQLDLDSMDFLNLVIALSKELNVEIPETDYRQLATLDGCVAYLAARAGRWEGERPREPVQAAPERAS